MPFLCQQVEIAQSGWRLLYNFACSKRMNLLRRLQLLLGRYDCHGRRTSVRLVHGPETWRTELPLAL